MSVTRPSARHPARRVITTVSVAVVAAATLALGGPGIAHAATVDISFVEPAKFVDAGRGTFETERTTKALSEIFQTYGKRLPASQALKIEVTDVDLAGDMHWSRAAVNEIRVLRGRADWPRMELRYTLTENGRVLKSGEARLSDMTYLQHSLSPRYREPLGYEQRMIDEWMTATFGPAAAP
ncbi:MAG: DUF3016 domain-containing protein [Rubrivivax sp.]|jgi:hypothetical protein|nr:DUF3016 domain-containing protein [Rubrivivax sp.]